MMLFKLPLYALFIYIVLADVGTATDNAAKTPKSTADATTSTTTTTVAYDTSKSPKADIHSVKYTNSTQTPNTHNVTSGTTQTAKTTSHDTTTITTKPSVRGLIDLPTDFVYAPDSKTPGLHLWTSQKILEPYNIEKVFVLCEPASPNGKSSITPSSPESETNKLIDVFGKEACEKAAKGSGSSRLMGKHIHEGKTRSDPPLKDGLIFSCKSPSIHPSI